MTKYLIPDRRDLRGWSKDFCEEILARNLWSKIYGRHQRYVILWNTVKRPEACACGSPDFKMYSITGNYETPTDYIFECQRCHRDRTHIVRPVGRPKGSKNKKKKPEPKLDWWAQMCRDAEKELYG